MNEKIDVKLRKRNQRNTKPMKRTKIQQNQRTNSVTVSHGHFATHRNGIQHVNCPHWTRHATTTERRATSRELADREKSLNAKHGTERNRKQKQKI